MSDTVYQIRAALGTTDGLTGIGEEWIVDPVDGSVIARFWNGNFVACTSSSLSLGATDGPTLLLDEAA